MRPTGPPPRSWQQLRVGARFAVVLAVLAVGLAGITAVSLTALNQVQEQTHAILHDQWPPRS